MQTSLLGLSLPLAFFGSDDQCCLSGSHSIVPLTDLPPISSLGPGSTAVLEHQGFGHQSPHNRNPPIPFGSPELNHDSLPGLTDSITGQLRYILYVTCIMNCILKVSWSKENFTERVMRKRLCSSFHCIPSAVLTEKVRMYVDPCRPDYVVHGSTVCFCPFLFT